VWYSCESAFQIAHHQNNAITRKCMALRAKQTPLSCTHDLYQQILHIRSVEEMAQIIALRAKTESIEVEADSLVALSQIGERATLRYSVQLLTPASIIAKTNGRSTISAGDIEEVDGLFYDAKSSAKLLAEHADRYIS
jgi:RuvB-like protein 1 (pontin 52)